MEKIIQVPLEKGTYTEAIKNEINEIIVTVNRGEM